MPSKHRYRPAAKGTAKKAKKFARADSHQLQSWHLMQAGKKRRLANAEPPEEP